MQLGSVENGAPITAEVQPGEFQPVGCNSIVMADAIFPAKRKRGVPFTSDKARECAKLSKEARDKKKKDAEEIARIVALMPAQLALERAELCAQEIKRTHKSLMEDALEPKERAQLLTALDRLLERERVLRGIPNPGSYRPSKPRTETIAGDATPL